VSVESYKGVLNFKSFGWLKVIDKWSQMIGKHLEGAQSYSLRIPIL